MLPNLGDIFCPFFCHNSLSFNSKSKQILVATLFFHQNAPLRSTFPALWALWHCKAQGMLVGLPQQLGTRPFPGTAFHQAKAANPQSGWGTDTCTIPLTLLQQNTLWQRQTTAGLEFFLRSGGFSGLLTSLTPLTPPCALSGGCEDTSAPTSACISAPMIKNHCSQLCALHHCSSWDIWTAHTLHWASSFLLSWAGTESGWDAEHKYYTGARMINEGLLKNQLTLHLFFFLSAKLPLCLIWQIFVCFCK